MSAKQNHDEGAALNHRGFPFPDWRIVLEAEYTSEFLTGGRPLDKKATRQALHWRAAPRLGFTLTRKS